ncbi:MAG: radical SAM protein [Humidesulfovibrio sp.]|uniref:B12-binding domain-containing radical SAM protein n=1 Tax=Humidesulfovibrio sp. TaxID=2910988 RepID=UPI0027354D7A|nr:radical SAM protein [Humidesulfovibrio sp.]MDP2848340.1 radical SAM protein [Humidesulfovibrio sp.]
MAHIQLIGLSEAKSPDDKVWKLPYAFPIIIRQLQKTRHSFDLLDTHLHKLTFPELLDKVSACGARVYGISAWSHNYALVKRLTEHIRRCHPDALIIVGGIISGNDDVLLLKTETDIVCTSAEGEFVLPELLDCVDRDGEGLAQVAGVSFRDKGTGEVVRTAKRPIMSLSQYRQQDMPAYEYFDEQLHEISRNLATRENQPIKAFPLLTMRGCPFRCTFCGHLHGQRFLRRTWEQFFDEVDFLVSRYGFTGFFSTDTNLFLNEREVDEYCRLYRERGMTFLMAAEVRLTFGSEDMFRKLRAHGVIVIIFGFESGSQEMLDRMQKGIQIDVAWDIIQASLRAGSIIHGNYIFGTPGENRRTIGETRDFLVKLSLAIDKQKEDFDRQGLLNTSGYGWSVLTLSPTSRLYQQARHDGLLPDEDAYLMSLGREELMRLAEGSSQKIALVQEGGDVNMSGFTSREALGHYVKYSLSLVQVRVCIAEFKTSSVGVLLAHCLDTLGHLARYLALTCADTLRGRRGYPAGPAPRTKTRPAHQATA